MDGETYDFIVTGAGSGIGRALALSPRTVEAHRAHLFDKLGAGSLAQLIRQYASLVERDAAARGAGGGTA